jgi:hypothetical protein
MDPVALAALLTELFLSIHDIGGYAVPEVYPEVRQISKIEIQQRACKGPCGVKAFYTPDEGVFIDETLDISRDVHARSILLHELVHYVQAESGRFDAMTNACVRSNRAEAEAYRVQNLYLVSIHSTHRVAMTGWAARCRRTEVPTPTIR